MNIFLNGIIEPFLKITEMHKLFIFHSLTVHWIGNLQTIMDENAELQQFAEDLLQEIIANSDNEETGGLFREDEGDTTLI